MNMNEMTVTKETCTRIAPEVHWCWTCQSRLATEIGRTQGFYTRRYFDITRSHMPT